MKRLLPLLLAGCAVFRHEPVDDVERVPADAAYSVDLGDRVLWLFGDTFSADRSTMVRNSVAIQRGKEFQHFDREFFRPPDGRGWIWPWAGFVAAGKLHLFLNQFVEAGRTDLWNFQYVRTWLAVVANYGDPAQNWRLEWSPVPHGAWGVAAVVVDDIAYIFGTRGLSWRVARVPAGRVADFKEWTVGEADLFPGAPEGSVSFRREQFVAIYSDGGLSADIVMRTAPAPAGPWSPARVIHRCPEGKQGLMCYAGKEHPELAQPDELVITYAVNSEDFAKVAREAWIYRPRLVRIPWK